MKTPAEDPPLTERRIVQRLMRERYRRGFCMPNFTPPKWWECDMFEITASGYFREYEVKLTVADFRRDSEKLQQVYTNGQMEQKKKHDLLEARDPRAPAQFYYVTPEGLLVGEQLPRWAGLIEIIDARRSEHGFHASRLYERVRVKAPQLHRVKMAPSPNHHTGTAYYRMHDLWKP